MRVRPPLFSVGTMLLFFAVSRSVGRTVRNSRITTTCSGCYPTTIFDNYYYGGESTNEGAGSARKVEHTEKKTMFLFSAVLFPSLFPTTISLHSVLALKIEKSSTLEEDCKTVGT